MDLRGLPVQIGSIHFTWASPGYRLDSETGHRVSLRWRTILEKTERIIREEAPYIVISLYVEEVLKITGLL